MEKSFENDYNCAPSWQKERYGRIVSNLGMKLSDMEKRYLLWLASNDSDTELVFTGLFISLRNLR